MLFLSPPIPPDEDKDVIEKILRHIGLGKTCLRATHRQARNHDRPAGNVSHIPVPEFTNDVDYSQIPQIDY